MSLDYQVPSKAALIVLMADRSAAVLPEPDLTRPWGEGQLELLLSAYLLVRPTPQ